MAVPCSVGSNFSKNGPRVPQPGMVQTEKIRHNTTRLLAPIASFAFGVWIREESSLVISRNRTERTVRSRSFPVTNSSFSCLYAHISTLSRLAHFLVRQLRVSSSLRTLDMIRVLLVDDYPIVRHLVRESLERHSDIHVIGEADTGEEAVAQADTLKPAVVVIDMQLPSMSGIQATTLIKRNSP